jgi:hypothetical protein
MSSPFMQRYRLPIFVSLFVVIFLFSAAPQAYASILDDVVNGVKKFFTPEPKKEFIIDSKIELAPDGDVDKNGQISAGDIIRFTYSLSNKTDREYSFATLKTNINRKQLNFIHNIIGTASLNDDGQTIIIPNYRIGANQVATIMFDARINYITDKDTLITTEGDFVDKDRKTVVKALKKEIKANKINSDKIPEQFRYEIKKIK